MGPNDFMTDLAEKILSSLFIPVEASGRHIHLSKEDATILFGDNYRFTPVKDLSQPGQYACKEKVTLKCSKGTMEGITILGPERGKTQVEISLTDAVKLGVKAPVRLSGDVGGSAGGVLEGPKGAVGLSEGIIVAKRHIHCTPEDAERFSVSDGEVVDVRIFGNRPLVLCDTSIRVSKASSTVLHIDYDEANACGFQPGIYCMILKKAR